MDTFFSKAELVDVYKDPEPGEGGESWTWDFGEGEAGEIPVKEGDFVETVDRKNEKYVGEGYDEGLEESHGKKLGSEEGYAILELKNGLLKLYSVLSTCLIIR